MGGWVPALVALVWVAVSTTALAQAPSTAPATPPAPAAGQGANQTAQPQTRPAIQNEADARLLLSLVRSALLALHHANITGNYTVLRDLGAPSFRDRNSAADLSQIFTNVRLARVDLATVAVIDPIITIAPTIDQTNTLRVQGAFATQPVPVQFEALFQPHDGFWRVFGLSVGVLPAGSLQPAEPQQSATPAPAAQQGQPRPPQQARPVPVPVPAPR